MSDWQGLFESPTDVLLVSAAPLDPCFPGGFAPRHASFASALAEQHRTKLVCVHDGNDAAFRDASTPRGLAAVHLVDGSAGASRDDPRIPRQSVGRRLRLPPQPNQTLVVTLTASVAHLALDQPRSLAVLEEAWERNPLPSGARSIQRAHHRAERLRYRDLYRRVGRRAVHVVAITPREKAHFSSFMPPDRISVIPFGLDADHYSPDPTVERDIDVLVVGAVNRAEQRVEDLVAGLRTNEATGQARCVIVGGEPRASILDLASPSVEIVGYVPDVRPYYARAKVVAIPTFTDIGIKTTMLQAWAMERPVVTSQAVLDASYGTDVGADSVPAMVRQIAHLLGHVEERERLGRSGRSLILKHHAEPQSTNGFATIVEAAVAAGRAARLPSD